MLCIYFLLLIGLLIINYILVIIILITDITDYKNKRLEDLQIIKTKNNFFYILYLIIISLILL